MVGAAGLVASTINNRNVRRASRISQPGGDGDHHRQGSRANIPAGSSTLPQNNPYAYSYTRPPNAPVNTGGGGGASTIAGGGPKLNNEEPEVIPEKMSLAEKIKFYVSLCLGIIASLCVFALLFLIPLVVEPSISTLLADFDPEPATCVTVDYTSATGLSKCGLWSSCREGCTSTPSQCHQIYVSYRKAGSKKKGRKRIQNFTILDPHEWLDESRWDVSYTQLLINAKGCGYPPRVKCDEFGDTYGMQGRTFPCFYSRTNPRLVVTDYNWDEAAQPLLLSLCLPTGLFAVSISILSFWYCPSCEERGKNKRPCRSRYQTTLQQDEHQLRTRSNSRGRTPRPHGNNNSNSNNNPQQDIPPVAVVQQPRPKQGGGGGGDGDRGGNHINGQRSPSLATISSRDTTVSSVTSTDDGWQSPPTPPPRLNSRMNTSRPNLTRTRKL